jgi:AraC family transcriptional regulator
MKVVKDTRFCVTNWSALNRKDWPSVVACAKQTGPITWEWPKRVTPLSIKCLIKSSETYELPGRAVTVDPNSFFIINEGTEYSSSINSTSDVETASVFISSDLLKEVASSLSSTEERLLSDPLVEFESSIQFTERLYPQDSQIVPTLRKIHQLANQDGGEAKLQEQMYLLTEHLLQLNRSVRTEIQSLDFVRASTREEVYRRLYACRDYMISNLSQPQDLTDVAAVSGFAPHHFLRLFRKVFGTTPHQYLTRLRLDKAKQLVQCTDRSISEICFDLGFDSIPSFSTLYKKFHSVSPKNHRKWI